jgi:hypothetical protein
MTNHDHVDSKHALSALVGIDGRTALRVRAVLIGSEVEREWLSWAIECPAITETIDEVIAAIDKLMTVIKQETDSATHVSGL